MRRTDVIDVLARLRTEEAVVVGPGSASGVLSQARHLPATIYNMELGYASAVCLGLALADPRLPVVAVEGDGSMLAGLGVLTTIARYRPENLTVLVLDNGRYATCGSGQFTSATAGATDLAAVARGCGLPPDRVAEVSDVDGTEQVLRRAFGSAGPWFVLAGISEPDEWPAGRGPLPEHDIVETAIALRRELADRRQRTARR